MVWDRVHCVKVLQFFLLPATCLQANTKGAEYVGIKRKRAGVSKLMPEWVVPRETTTNSTTRHDGTPSQHTKPILKGWSK